MVDSREKYDIILKRSKPENGPNGQPYPKFEDTQFKHEDRSIGDDIMSKLSSRGRRIKWIRLSEQPGIDY